MRINVAVPDQDVRKDVLDGMLEGVTRLNEHLIEDGGLPTWDEALEGHGIRWKPEPPGQEHFDHGGIVLGRGWGDCDDLAPWHAASLRVTGEDPDAQAIVYRSGPKRWHAVVERGDGSIDDPSREAGMGKKKHGVVGAVVPVMGELAGTGVDGVYTERPQLALRPYGKDAWQARADLPWHHDSGSSPSDIAMVSLHKSPVAAQAIVGALRGAVVLGEESGCVGEDVLDRADAIADYLDGCPVEELVGIYGEEHALAAEEVGKGFFKHLWRGIKKVALPIASKVVSFVPGVGPVASTALDVAQGAIKAADKAAARKKAARAVTAKAHINVPSPQAAIHAATAHLRRRRRHHPSHYHPAVPGYDVRRSSGGRVFICHERR